MLRVKQVLSVLVGAIILLLFANMKHGVRKVEEALVAKNATETATTATEQSTSVNAPPILVNHGATSSNSHAASNETLRLGGDGDEDVCIIAHAMEQLDVWVRSYSRAKAQLISSKPHSDGVSHPTRALCMAAKNKQKTDNKDADFIHNGGMMNKFSSVPLQSVFAFKAARTGSTFFTTTLTQTIKKMGRPAVMYWEPYCHEDCNAVEMPREQVENGLKSLMTQACSVKRPMKTLPRNKTKAKCAPEAFCQPAEHNNTVFLSAANPRFFNRTVQWENVLHSHSRIFTLRRTNLVLMGNSKLDHAGCGISFSDLDVNQGEEAVQPGQQQQQRRLKKQVSQRRKLNQVQQLLNCMEHYALWDQEFSSGVALKAASATSHGQLHLVVYEDVTANGDLVQNGLMEYLGMNITNENMFNENAVTSKKHVNSVCTYKGFDCDAMKKVFVEQNYPCLLKQLELESENHVWTVPMLPNGTVSIHGDCKILEPLGSGKYIRTLDELYQLPY